MKTLVFEVLRRNSEKIRVMNTYGMYPITSNVRFEAVPQPHQTIYGKNRLNRFVHGTG